MSVGKRSITRCAIYARKSSDDGLEQSFNSIDAQRVSGESYITAHEGEGWVCLPNRYDDGGYSGGNMDRPGLTRLLDEVRAGRVETVVCYKLDRLTRSIRDFAKIMEVFEAHGVALVVVTQPINTSTSMGRLMVHVLMSFAQFERELASERTRDKIALSRQRGQWTGGRPVLGYDFAGSRLERNVPESQTVRAIFARYLEVRSLRVLLKELEDQGVTNKRWTSRAGREMGGKPFVLSGLAGLLGNPLYVGKVPHHGRVYDGLHEPIVDSQVFQRVQELLAENGRSGVSLVRNQHGGLLKGLARCAGCGATMVHSTTSRGGATGRVHRYYVCRTRQLHGKGRCAGGSVPAEQIEQFVLAKMRPAFTHPLMAGAVLDLLRARFDSELRTMHALKSMTEQAFGELEKSADAGRGALSGEWARLRERLRELDDRIELHMAAAPTREKVDRGLADIEGLWSVLSPSERAALLSMVVSEVCIDAAGGEVTIVTRDTGDSAPTSRAEEAA
ncbi:MAG: recombinase family protein [Phycisphaerales bacterium]|nr:recombinase family protein [Phycisphaerales bacterium]